MIFFEKLRLLILSLFLLGASSDVSAVPIDQRFEAKKMTSSSIDELIEAMDPTSANAKIKLQLLQRLKSTHSNHKESTQGLALIERSNAKAFNQSSYWKLFTDVASFTQLVGTMAMRTKNVEKKANILKEKILEANDTNGDVKVWQIQYAIYRLRISHLSKATPTYKKQVELLKKRLGQLVEKISYSSTDLQNELKQVKLKKKQLENQLMLFSIENDQEESESATKAAEKRKENEVLRRIEKLILQVARYKIEESFNHLNSDKPKIALAALQEARSLTINSQFTNKGELALNSRIDLAQFILSENISSFNLLLYSTSLSLQKVAGQIFSLAYEPIVFFGDKKITIWGTIKFVLIFAIGLFFAQSYKRRVTKIGKGRYKITVANRTIISNIGYYIIILVTFFAALNLLGLDLSSLTVVAGALSVGIGFGLQKIFADFMSGVIMLFEKSIKMGDYIEVSSSLRGRVTEIRMRSSTITTNDNINLIIPNSTLMESNVINWTLNDTIVRLKVYFSVAYGTSYKDLEKAILEGLEKSDLHYLKHDKSRETELRMTQMNTSGVDYCLLVWVSGISTKFSEKTKSEFLKFIYNSLSEHDMEIPFPQLDVHVKEGLGQK